MRPSSGVLLRLSLHCLSLNPPLPLHTPPFLFNLPPLSPPPPAMCAGTRVRGSTRAPGTLPQRACIQKCCKDHWQIHFQEQANPFTRGCTCGTVARCPGVAADRCRAGQVSGGQVSSSSRPALHLLRHLFGKAGGLLLQALAQVVPHKPGDPDLLAQLLLVRRDDGWGGAVVEGKRPKAASEAGARCLSSRLFVHAGATARPEQPGAGQRSVIPHSRPSCPPSRTSVHAPAPAAPHASPPTLDGLVVLADEYLVQQHPLLEHFVHPASHNFRPARVDHGSTGDGERLAKRACGAIHAGASCPVETAFPGATTVAPGGARHSSLLPLTTHTAGVWCREPGA